MAYTPASRLTVPDETFPFLTVTQGGHFRDLVRTAFADAGCEVRVDLDGAIDADGYWFGLANVAAKCHNAITGESSWPQVVRDHVAVCVATARAPSPFAGMTIADVLAATYPRVVPTDGLPGEITYGRPVAQGLSEVLNLDLPDQVAYFTDDQVARVGRDELVRAARRNLGRVEPADPRVIRDGDAAAVLLTGDSWFIASLVLRLPEVFERLGRSFDGGRGVLVALPHRHQLVFHVVQDGSAVASLALMSRFAVLGHQDFGDLTPNVFWWRPIGMEPVTELTADGVRAVPNAAFSTMLDQLT